MSTRFKVPSKAVATIIAGLAIVSLTALIGYRWLLANFVKPEADMAPLSTITRADSETLKSLGVLFPETEGELVVLSTSQIKALVERYGSPEAPIRLTNHYGFPYEISVSRSSDRSSPSGAHYRWIVRDLGEDGKAGTTDDLTDLYSNRPLVDRPQ